MKIVTLIARLLLGLGFTVFGANIFLNFIHVQPPPMPELAQKFNEALFASHYLYVVGAVQLIGGLLLLSGFFVPVGLSMLGPVLVNILCFHLLLEKADVWPMPVFFVALWLVVFAGYWKSFESVLKPKPDSQTT